jgi:AcrR family transcriptional regulator
VPKPWTHTIGTHRREMHDAILDTTVRLAAEHGPLSVTMSQIAERTGIGSAALHKHFPDVEAILLAWHERQISNHLELLAQVRDQADHAGARLEAVLKAYALIHHQRVQHHRHKHHGAELDSFLHQDKHLADARHQVHAMFSELLAETSGLRDDVPIPELATYCLNALGAASSLASKAEVERLVSVTLAGLRPPR